MKNTLFASCDGTQNRHGSHAPNATAGLFALALFGLAMAPQAALAQGIDCTAAIEAGTAAVEKTNADLTGMDAFMPPERMVAIRSILGDAQMLLENAVTVCGGADATPYDLARGVARASAAKAYAEAADMLHFEYMMHM